MPISTLRRTAAVAAFAAGSLTFLAEPAGAQACYPPTDGCVSTTSSVATTGPAASVSDDTVTPGQRITVSATGFRAGSTGIVTIESVEQQIGTFTVPATGPVTVSVTIPNTISPGAHTIFVRGTGLNGQPAFASRRITVVSGGTGGTGSGGGTLARTGVVVVPTALVGVGLVIGGTVLKRSGRRGKATNPG